MKKTLVALAVAAMAATSANAATVYEQDGTKVELSGSLRMFLGRDGDDNRGDLKNDDSRIYLKVSQDLGNGLSAFGGYQIRFAGDDQEVNRGSNTDFDNPNTHELYLGFRHEDIGALSFGKQQTNADDFLSDAAYYRSADISPLTTRADKSVKFRSAEWNGFSFGLDYLFGDEDKNSNTRSGNYKNGYAAVAFYNYDISDGHSFNVRALYSLDQLEGIGSETGLEIRQWGARLGYMYGPFDIAASYVNYKNEYKHGYTGVGLGRGLATDTELLPGLVGDNKGNYILVDAGYRVFEPSRLYVQWERLDVEAENDDFTAGIKNRYTAGIDYEFNKYVVPYIQYTHERTKRALAYTPAGQDSTKKDNIFGVGLRIHF